MATRLLPKPGTCVDMSNDGLLIVVGMKAGGGVGLYSTDTLQLFSQKKHRKNPITAVRFSPDSSSLAVASDGFLDIYSIDTENGELARLAVCIAQDLVNCRSIDWCKRSRSVRACNFLSSKHYTFIASTGSNVSSDNMGAMDWHSEHCAAASTASGLTTAPDAVTAFCSVSVGIGLGAKIGSKALNVAGTVDGTITFASDKMQSAGQVHTGPVSGLAFSHDKSQIISVGSSDQLLILWKTNLGSTPSVAGGTSLALSERHVRVHPWGPELEGIPSVAMWPHHDQESSLPAWLMLSRKSVPGLTQTFAVHPDLDLKMLMSVETQEPAVPTLHLHSVLGPVVCGGMAVGNRVVYGCGSAVVIYQTTTGAQQFILGHDKAVTVIAAHPNHSVCASGDEQALPEVIVWSCEDSKISGR